MNIKKDIIVPIYNAKIIIVITDDLPSAAIEYCDDDCTYDDAITLHFDSPLNYVSCFRVDKLSHMIVSHEVCHIVHRIMNDVGIEHTLLTDEPEAYLVSYITNQIYKIIKTNHLMCYERKG